MKRLIKFQSANSHMSSDEIKDLQTNILSSVLSKEQFNVCFPAHPCLLRMKHVPSSFWSALPTPKYLNKHVLKYVEFPA